jgi:hypothetical protein
MPSDKWVGKIRPIPSSHIHHGRSSLPCKPCYIWCCSLFHTHAIYSAASSPIHYILCSSLLQSTAVITAHHLLNKLPLCSALLSPTPVTCRPTKRSRIACGRFFCIGYYLSTSSPLYFLLTLTYSSSFPII